MINRPIGPRAMSIELFSEGYHSLEAVDPKSQFTVSMAEAPVEIIDLTNRVGMEETPVDPKLCSLCRENIHKYRCKFCDADTNDHEKEKEKIASAPLPTKIPRPVFNEDSTPRPGTLAAANAKGPFECLDNSNELKEVFNKYPNLRSLLEKIYSATLRPTGANSHKWNQDKGWEDGRACLKMARTVCGRDGEAIREYCNLVLRLVGDEEQEESLAKILQREALDESTRVIRELLESEKRR
ncbi:hypothetical protein DSL72_002906 [Monilinia vaccinii-corymbosi]|uniref:Uncharacterized protein n=1 Tax=Monilinia vaccinii-corymbosi TaxID=61207 RepID=A0A8A3PDW8_9HELO|nr:hypothetical protein DSL72_002906 [Monilinia vaccinii-corymbosi]